MTKTLLPLCAALLLLAPATSFAAPAEGGDSYVNDEGGRVTQKGDTREIVIDDGEAIDGESLKPGGEQLYGARGVIHASMISVRLKFTEQLIALANDI